MRIVLLSWKETSFDRTSWHEVFAWVPKIIDTKTSVYFVWLETVERRWCDPGTGGWEYRMVPK